MNLNDLRAKYEAGVAAAKHVLVIGPTKSGKSDWVTQAAIDGFHVIYIDRDNGIGTLLERTKGNIQAGERITYFRPPDMLEFVEKLFTNSIFRWNMTQNVEFKSMSANADDDCVEIRHMELDNNVIVSLDTWSTLVFDTYRYAAKVSEKALGDLDKLDRDIYGISNVKLSYLANLIQLAPFHVIVQAHPAFYERKEKPEGDTVKATKEGEFIIREVIDIPYSSSNPHGYNLGSKFTDIGWMKIMKNMGKRELDFKVEYGRISGGSITTSGDPRTTHSFKNLFFPKGVPTVDATKGMRFFKAAEFKTQAPAIGAVKSTPTTQADGEPASPAATPKFTIGKKP